MSEIETSKKQKKNHLALLLHSLTLNNINITLHSYIFNLPISQTDVSNTCSISDQLHTCQGVLL